MKQVLQVLLFYGCVFNEGSSGGQLGSIPLKPKLMCLFGANKKKVREIVCMYVIMYVCIIIIIIYYYHHHHHYYYYYYYIIVVVVVVVVVVRY